MGFLGFMKKKDFSTPSPLDTPPPLDSMPSTLPGSLGNPPMDRPAPMSDFNSSFGSSSPPPLEEPSFDIHERRYERMNIDKPKMDMPSVDNRDVQLILSRLDTIRAELDNIKERLGRIERFASEPDKPKYKW